MASFFKNAFGGSKPAEPVANPDSDFADFAEAASPAPEPVVQDATAQQAAPSITPLPYTKWYAVHERHSLSEFKSEGIIIVVAFFIVIIHLIGARANRKKAKAYMRAHAPILTKEFALVGFGGAPTMDKDVNTDTLIKEKSLFEFATYATGRQNVAFTDVKLTLSKKFNPIVNGFEHAVGFFVDSMEAPKDAAEAILYPFDGKEHLTVPSVPGAVETRSKDSKSTYDGFVWAVVNKDAMRRIRDDRYDVSLTSTKDSPKLPNWLTVMSENAEVTDALLTPELIEALKSAGDAFQYLIVSDQPTEKPASVDETTPRKRMFLKYNLPSNGNYDSLLPIFSHFLQLPDSLVKVGHFRPEVTRRLRNTRENNIAGLRKAEEEERAEERAVEKEKARKAKREADLKGLDAKAQKKYLDKEREKEMRKSSKKQTIRG